MLYRFCNLCNKAIDAPVIGVRKYVRGIGNARLRELPDESEYITKPINDLRNEDMRVCEQKKIPIITTPRKELEYYHKQAYPRYKDVPLISSGWLHSKSVGDHFFIHPEYNMLLENDEPQSECSFESLDIDSQLIDKLQQGGIMEPTDIQTKAIPIIMGGENAILAGETGCGKTLAYLIPMIKLIQVWKGLVHRPLNCPLGVIITPTRELSVQIGIEARKICKDLGLSVSILTGGKTKKIILDPPVEKVDILIGSFGVVSKLTTVKIYKLHFVRHIVLDEADALFHPTFEDKMKIFLRRVPIGYNAMLDNNGFPTTARLTLTSATMPTRMEHVLAPVVSLESFNHVTTSKVHRILVPQKFIRVAATDKPEELLRFLKPKYKNKLPVIIFANYNKTVEWVNLFLEENNIRNVSLHGDMVVARRYGRYADFRSGRVPVLVTTNAASRGLDTTMVRHVLNYEFPDGTIEYIHRCGRTGRVVGPKDYRVTNFISKPWEVDVVKKIERAIRKGKTIPLFESTVKQEDSLDLPLEENEIQEIHSVEEEDSIPY